MSASLWRRNGLVAVSVLGLHAGLIWALQHSLVAPVHELIVPVSVLTQTPEAPALAATPPQPVTKPSSSPPRTALKPDPPKANQLRATPLPPAPNTPAPSTVATAVTAPTTEASTSASTPATTSGDVKVSTGAATPANTGAGAAASSAPTAPALQLPSSDADYLRNPKPVYPALSKRLNEQGTAIHSVLIAADGRPVSARLVKSSGFDRLDKAAYEAVMQWRYVPGKRQGVPEAMTFNVPIKWVLE